MLKKLFACAVSVFILCGVTGCSLVKQDMIEVVHETEVPPDMVFLGDSIAAGYGLDGYTSTDNYSCSDSYANILKSRYTTELNGLYVHNMQNFAVSGATSSDLLELLNSGTIDSALAGADAVVVSIGGNDLLHIMFDMLKNLGVTAENRTINISEFDLFGMASSLLSMDSDIDEALSGFEINLQKISEVLNEKTDGRIYVQTLYNPLETFSDVQAIVDFSDQKIDRFNEIIETGSAEYSVIDVASGFKGRCAELTRISEIDIHPNEKGHAEIAGIIDSAFRADGFSCTVQEYGEPYLPLSTIFLILGGFCAMLVVVILIIPKLFKKYE
ncbi:MAG: SGNH/GDSL hydrolase family protein [Ruminococcus sp.]|nr:SGNH/GDSL hydrolase family protein [Ruminococcus sp.]